MNGLHLLPCIFSWPRKRITAAAAVVLMEPVYSKLPQVVLTLQKTGRHEEPPNWEIASGHTDPVNPLKPDGKWESAKATAFREADEEVGARPEKLSLFGLRIINNPPNSKYPPRSYMAYYVGFVNKLYPPSDRQHSARSISLETVGDLRRRGMLDKDEMLIIRTALISVGFSQSDVDRALGWPPI